MVVPGDDFLLGEPELDLLLSILNGIRSVADVSAGDDAVISSDGSGVGIERVSGSEDLSSGGDCGFSLPNHADNGAGEHVFDECGEEGPCGEVGIVSLEMLAGRLHELECSEVVTSLLEAGDDGSHQSSLHTVRLDHDVGTLSHLLN